MKRTAVYIATTEGPSAIQRITAEDTDVRSVICLAGKAISLPISADYDAFVRRPTGIIEDCFGHGAFRADISHPIASGLSWQLGLFAAHALMDRKTFASPHESATQVLWVTGEVRRDLEVESVADVDLKIRQSSDLFHDLLSRNIKLLIAVPAGNHAEAEAALTSVLRTDAGDLQLVSVEHVSDLLNAAGMKHRRQSRRWRVRSPASFTSRNPSYRAALYGISAVLSLAVLVSGWSSFESPVRLNAVQKKTVPFLPASWRPPGDILVATAIESRAPAGKPCAAVHLDAVAPSLMRRSVSGQTNMPEIQSTALCDFRYRITNKSDHTSTVWVMATRASASGTQFRLRPVHDAKPLLARGVMELDARPPRTVASPLKQDFLLLSLPGGASAGNRLGDLVARAQAVTSEAELATLLDAAQRQGASLLRLSQRFTP